MSAAFQIFTEPSQQALDTSARVLPGATLSFFLTATSTATNAYADKDLTTPLANPLSANSGGVFPPVFLDPSVVYRIVLKTAGGVTLQTWDPANENVLSSDRIAAYLTQSIIGQLLYPRTDAEIAAGVTPTYYFYPAGDIRRYGAVSGGSASTNTTAIQAAVDSNYNVYVPPGTFSCNTITLRAGVRIYGDGAQSILSQNTITDGSYGTLYANSGSSGSTVDDILIERLQVLGNVSGLGFSQFQHLISLNGVSRVVIRNCLIKGFRGDGIYVGSGVVAGNERHNARIKILNNVIDGVNNDNRNGISIIDCDDALIEGNTFVNCTRSNMPGPVDIEPDAFTFHIVRNIRVLNNHFVNCGGNVAQIALVLSSTNFAIQPENFKFNGNTFSSSANGFVVNNSVTSYARPLKVEFCNNSGTVADPWQVFTYCDGLIIANNQLRFTGDPVFGASNTDIVKNLVMTGNILTGDGVTTGIALRSGNCIEINDNLFAGCAGFAILLGGSGATLNEVGVAHNSMLSTVQIGVQFGGGTVTNVRIVDNDFSRVSSAAFAGTIPADTRIRGNKGYVSENGGVTAAIATGATVSHGCGATPVNVSVTALDVGPTDIYVTAIGASTFTINYGGGGTHVFSWEAKTSYHYAQ
jgi:hypothetical protein